MPPPHRPHRAREQAQWSWSRLLAARQTPEVSECHRISGEDCFLIKMHAAAIEDIEETLDRFLTCGQTITSVVVATPVPPRTLPVTD